MKEAKPTELDGRTGEGGGQLVRVACALAAVTTQPIRISHVRGNREGPRGGGLKSQHVSGISWLAEATGAEVTGLSVGSHTLEFRPRLAPSQLVGGRTIAIAADSAAASTLLIFQAVLPFLLFAGNEQGQPIDIAISGGINVAWSPSFEYVDQVLLPALERLFVGLRVERRLDGRGWSQGRIQRGSIAFTIHPLRPGETLRLRDAGIAEGPEAGEEEEEEQEATVSDVDVSIIAPSDMHEALTDALTQDLGDLFPGADVHLKVVEESGADARVYALLVARSEKTGRRWGRDILTSAAAAKKGGSGKGGGGGAKRAGKKNSSGGGGGSSNNAAAGASASIARKVSKELFVEVSSGGMIDEFLQDQLVIFQALAEGRSSFPRGGGGDDADAPKEVKSGRGGGDDATAADLGEGMEKLDIAEQRPRLRRDKAQEPFGEGSMHTKTARWVTTELLPQVRWYNKGTICEGAGMRMEKS